MLNPLVTPNYAGLTNKKVRNRHGGLQKPLGAAVIYPPPSPTLKVVDQFTGSKCCKRVRWCFAVRREGG